MNLSFDKFNILIIDAFATLTFVRGNFSDAVLNTDTITLGMEPATTDYTFSKHIFQNTLASLITGLNVVKCCFFKIIFFISLF